jgi:Ni/Co efflux regulator RcnB
MFEYCLEGVGLANDSDERRYRGVSGISHDRAVGKSGSAVGKSKSAVGKSTIKRGDSAPYKRRKHDVKDK